MNDHVSSSFSKVLRHSMQIQRMEGFIFFSHNALDAPRELTAYREELSRQQMAPLTVLKLFFRILRSLKKNATNAPRSFDSIQLKTSRFVK